MLLDLISHLQYIIRNVAWYQIKIDDIGFIFDKWYSIVIRDKREFVYVECSFTKDLLILSFSIDPVYIGSMANS